ncbi:translation initiation factor IF-2-like isoform X1 [Cervus canadensis]|uniref:translation initiation factor IF-2-like isoform X1 n=1 Tax=Cervus canadensis TaxID=1574408 RepID=UPI001C9E4C77|nr:translation initiation factor IF-2-like isoform X1 [Cervus canadensis]
MAPTAARSRDEAGLLGGTRPDAGSGRGGAGGAPGRSGGARDTASESRALTPRHPTRGPAPIGCASGRGGARPAGAPAGPGARPRRLALLTCEMGCRPPGRKGLTRTRAAPAPGAGAAGSRAPGRARGGALRGPCSPKSRSPSRLSPPSPGCLPCPAGLRLPSEAVISLVADSSLLPRLGPTGGFSQPSLQLAAGLHGPCFITLSSELLQLCPFPGSSEDLKKEEQAHLTGPAGHRH